MRFHWLSLNLLLLLAACDATTSIEIAQTLLLQSGEPNENSIILQCRFNATDTLVQDDIAGLAGKGYFEISSDSSFKNSTKTAWMEAAAENDYTIRSKMDDLSAHTTYYYKVVAEWEGKQVQSYTASFMTLPASSETASITFVASSCGNYEKFYGIDRSQKAYPTATPEDQKLGFEAYETVLKMKPDFFISNGDIVYYDHPPKQPETWAKTQQQMRAKWHRQFAMSRHRNLLKAVPVYYLKDDHDYRYNDADTTIGKWAYPTHNMGIDMLREQLPIVDLTDSNAKTYRTYKAGKLLQIWMMEGRDYRSANQMEDSPAKSLWGAEQKAWLKRSLLESDAVFKIMVSPTPLIGPDDAYKIDNHTNLKGFKQEGEAFFSWLKANQFDKKNFYIICGDRHWQYHSVRPDGFEEFCSGTFVNQNARAGRAPGDPKSTDPNALITAQYIQLKNNISGGFIKVEIAEKDNIPTAIFNFYNTRGKKLYSAEKTANI